jgi:isoquinoline 1-oxidoreductase subunit alpha
MPYTININDESRTVDVDGDTPPRWVLRDVLGMTGTKFGCGMALCGAYTVHQDGQLIRSCRTTVDSIATSKFTTIEAGKMPAGWRIHEAWLTFDVQQCGYCKSSQIMSAAALLAVNPRPRLRAI